MKKMIVLLVMLMLAMMVMGCSDEPQAATGVKMATADIQVGADGLTVEQSNCKGRAEMENVPGAIKHLYVLSAYSGQVIIYSTVKGKITSSNKRLTPDTVFVTNDSMHDSYSGFAANIRGQKKYTSKVLQDDGTYGSSIPYLYWWDSQGRYHQHYVSGGQILHVSDQPLAVKSIILNMEITNNE